MEWVNLVLFIMYFSFLAFFWHSRQHAWRERNALKDKLEELQKKSQLEQDIELATTSQLMKEVANRVPGFILLMPTATNKQNENEMSIHIKGIHPEAAVQCMSMAAYIIKTRPPSGKFTEE